MENELNEKEEKAIDNYNDYIGILTNWNKLKEYIDTCLATTTMHLYTMNAYKNIQNKMQELEGGNK